MLSDNIRKRRKYFLTFCSRTVADYLSINHNYNNKEKEKIIEIAKHIAEKNNHFRVYWVDLVLALRIWRDKK